jgi:hypothetical protein
LRGRDLSSLHQELNPVGCMSQEVEQRGYVQGDWSTERGRREDEGQTVCVCIGRVERRRFVVPGKFLGVSGEGEGERGGLHWRRGSRVRSSSNANHRAASSSFLFLLIYYHTACSGLAWHRVDSSLRYGASGFAKA